MSIGLKKLFLASLYYLFQFPINAQIAYHTFNLDDSSYIRNFNIKTVEILRPDYFPKNDEEKKRKGYETDGHAYQKLYFSKQGKILRREYGTYPEDDGKWIISYLYGRNNKIAKIEESMGLKPRKTLLYYDNQNCLKTEVIYNHKLQEIFRFNYDWQKDTLLEIKNYTPVYTNDNISLKYTSMVVEKYNEMNKLIERKYYDTSQNKNELTGEVIINYRPNGQIEKETYIYSNDSIEIIYNYDSENKIVNMQSGNEQTQYHYTANGLLTQSECSSINGNETLTCTKVIYKYTFW